MIDLRSRFRLSACGWAATAPHGDPSHASPPSFDRPKRVYRRCTWFLTEDSREQQRWAELGLQSEGS
jgi:hypothetical protein